MSTLTVIRDECEARFQDTGNLIVTEATWLLLINSRYRRVMGDNEQWPFLEAQGTVSVTASTRSGALPTGVYTILAAWNDTDNVKMVPIDSYRAYRAEFPDDDESGTPVFYRVVDDDLWVWPKPTATTSIKIDYRVAEADLAAADSPAFPSQFHPILISGALADAYLDDGNLRQYEVHEGHFQEQLAKMRHELLTARTERYHQIVDDFYGD